MNDFIYYLISNVVSKYKNVLLAPLSLHTAAIKIQDFIVLWLYYSN